MAVRLPELGTSSSLSQPHAWTTSKQFFQSNPNPSQIDEHHKNPGHLRTREIGIAAGPYSSVLTSPGQFLHCNIDQLNALYVPT